MKIFQTAIVFIWILIAVNQSIADSGQSEISLDTITVTANKQEEDIQKVPMSITAFDEFTLENKNITSVRDLTYYVPNLILTDQGVSGSACPVMRGVVAELGTFNVSTAMFVDGIPVLSFNGYEDTLQNIERVEVLRGPQGTLYGKSAEAGAINIITRQPDNTFRGKVSIDGGEDYKKDVDFNLSGPIIQDKFFFGVSGQYYSKDGFITNGYTDDEANDEAHWYGKGQFRWTPTDSLDISVIFSQLQYDNDGNSMGLSEDGAANYGWVASGDREIYSDFDTKEESKISTQAFKVSYDINDTLNLTSITTHRLFQADSAYDYDFNSFDGLHGTDKSEFDKISQELRLVSNTEKINGVVGVYYDTDDNTTDQVIETYGMGFDRDHEGETYALFGQLRYALTPKLGVTGGLRYENQNKDMYDNDSGKSFDDSWEDIAPKFSVDYALTEQIMVYTTVAKGFQSGGFNVYSTSSEYDSYDSEELWSYEIGAKSQFLDNRLIVTCALFYMDIDNMQVTQDSISPPWTYITNAATAVSYGAELELRAKITPQFTITASAGYTNAEFDEYQDGENYSNNTPPNVPEYTFSIGGQYRTGNGFYVGVDLVGVGETYLERTNTYKRDAYQLINAKIGYEAENWDIYLYGKNIFDEDYSKEDATYVYYSDPRELGAKLTYRF